MRRSAFQVLRMVPLQKSEALVQLLLHLEAPGLVLQKEFLLQSCFPQPLAQALPLAHALPLAQALVRDPVEDAHDNCTPELALLLPREHIPQSPPPMHNQILFFFLKKNCFSLFITHIRGNLQIFYSVKNYNSVMNQQPDNSASKTLRSSAAKTF